MKALILNSGMGSRMGEKTVSCPKCMMKLYEQETILSRQLKILDEFGIKDIVITTGYNSQMLEEYCNSLNMNLNILFVRNEKFDSTNYIYSIYCAREYLDDDIILMHGDLVFEKAVLLQFLDLKYSAMVVSSVQELPEKDFKAVVNQDRIEKIGVDFFEKAVAAQPLYFLKEKEWNIWLREIIKFCEQGKTEVYAENAFNDISEKCDIRIFDIKKQLCKEVDTPEDLNQIIRDLKSVENQTVYVAFSTDIVHGGHIALLKKASCYGKVIVGILTDEAVLTYKRFPLLPCEERKLLFQTLTYVTSVVEQQTLSYKDNIKKYMPNYVVHGDDWCNGILKPIREEVVRELSLYGGKLIEFPYVKSNLYMELEKRARAELSLPDMRRSRLKRILQMKGFITALEAHNGITGLIVENTICNINGETRQFDAMWVSSLCDSTAKGKPDIELVDMTSRYRTIDEIMEVTTKPIIFDGDTGGIMEHFVYTVRTLERMGVSMIIIEDKIGLKKNSLFGTEISQTQDSIEGFCAKISAGKQAKKTKDFMICARIESLILEQGMEDAIIRARAYANAGADAIMIHSRKKDPIEIYEFVEKYRLEDKITPIVVVPTSYSQVKEEELKQKGVNIVIYANQLTRSSFPVMQKVAHSILENHRAKECEEYCMSIRDIITLIPEEI